MAKIRLYRKERTAEDRALARQAIAKWGRSRFKVGQWVVTRSGIEAKVIGAAVMLGLGWEYRLRARGSKRTFYRRQHELVPMSMFKPRRASRPRKRKGKIGFLGY